MEVVRFEIDGTLYSQYIEITIYKVGGDISDGAKTL